MLIKPSSSHWYKYTDGAVEPFYEVESKSKPGTYRSATLRDARVVGALPSVTNVLSVINKEGLTNWRVEQGILAALTLPKIENEPLERFAQRVVVDMDKQRDEAAVLGTAIHEFLEDFVSSSIDRDKGITCYIPDDSRLTQLSIPPTEWLSANVESYTSSERCIGSACLGYAGRMDLDCVLKDIGPAVVDFKTTRVKKNLKGEAKPEFYDEWPLQLAAYAKLLFHEDMVERALVSLVIDTGSPGVYSHVWDQPGTYLPAFHAAFDLWKYLRGYDPTQARKELEPETA